MPITLKNLLLLVILFAAACTHRPTPEPSTIPTAATPPATSTAIPATPTFIPTPTLTPASEPTAPTLGNWHDMVFHETAGQVVLVNGGPETGKPASDPLELWGWDGTRWTLLSADPAGPPWRNFAATAYDTARQVLVLYGGLQSEAVQFDDTWEWDGSTWTQSTAPGPGPREGVGMAYDSLRAVTVLFGGAQDGQMMADSWEWDGAEWNQAAGTGPSPRFPAGFAFDAARGNLVLFGGHAIDDSGFHTFGDTWLWDGAAWTLAAETGPAPRDGARLVFDSQSGGLLLFGGAVIDPAVSYFTDTWLWDGAAWQELAVPGPPGRVHPAMAYDPLRGRIVLAGGSNAPGAILSDVWEWNGEAWSCVFRCE